MASSSRIKRYTRVEVALYPQRREVSVKGVGRLAGERWLAAHSALSVVMIAIRLNRKVINERFTVRWIVKVQCR